MRDEKSIEAWYMEMLFRACANVVDDRLLDKKWNFLSPGIPQQSQSIRFQRVRRL
jgi:hypothetical protein